MCLFSVFFSNSAELIQFNMSTRLLPAVGRDIYQHNHQTPTGLGSILVTRFTKGIKMELPLLF